MRSASSGELTTIILRVTSSEEEIAVDWGVCEKRGGGRIVNAASKPARCHTLENKLNPRSCTTVLAVIGLKCLNSMNKENVEPYCESTSQNQLRSCDAPFRAGGCRG